MFDFVVLLCGIDIFFVIELWLAYNDEIDIQGENEMWLQFLFIFGCFFIVAPITANLFQLNKEIKGWITDNDTKRILQPWIVRHGKIFYLLTIITGSAFSAVELCDSHLFQLSLFSLNIPSRQKQIFKNQRVFSIVLLENIPQFCMQVIYLFVINTNNNTDNNNTNIVFISMTFSVLSIVLTLFEYTTKKFVFDSEFLMIIQFKIDSKEIQNMSGKQFDTRIGNKRKDISVALSKILRIQLHNIEQLKPVYCREGASITFHIRFEEQLDPKTAMNELEESIDSQILNKAIRHAYGLLGLPQISNLDVTQQGPENKGVDAVTTISVRSKKTTPPPMGKSVEMKSINDSIKSFNGAGNASIFAGVDSNIAVQSGNGKYNGGGLAVPQITVASMTGASISASESGVVNRERLGSHENDNNNDNNGYEHKNVNEGDGKFVHFGNEGSKSMSDEMCKQTEGQIDDIQTRQLQEIGSRSRSKSNNDDAQTQLQQIYNNASQSTQN